MAARFKTIHETGQVADFARALRALVEASMDREGEETLRQFSDRTGKSLPVISTALNGRALPSESQLRAIVTAATPKGADVQAEINRWQERRRAIDTAPPDRTESLVQRLRNGWQAWELPPETAPDYRHFTRLLPEAELLEALDLARIGALDGVDDGLWAWLVVSAVQHGNSYKQWFDLARPAEAAVDEALIERVMDRHRSPRWRAAWLLQDAAPALKPIVLDVARELPAASGSDSAQIGRILHAIQTQEIEQLIADLPDHDLDSSIRTKLLREFEASRVNNAARGRVRARITQGGRPRRSSKPRS